MALEVEPSPLQQAAAGVVQQDIHPHRGRQLPPPSGDKYLLPSSQQVPWTTAVVGYKWIFYFKQGSSTLAKFTFKREK